MEEAPVELAHFHFGWHIPEVRHHDIPALDVLSTILGSGEVALILDVPSLVASAERGAAALLGRQAHAAPRNGTFEASQSHESPQEQPAAQYAAGH
jgi:predicted Zn-dependent peptidase